MDCKISTAKADHFYELSKTHDDLAQLVIGCEEYANSSNILPPLYTDESYVCIARRVDTNEAIGFLNFYIFDNQTDVEVYIAWVYIDIDYRNANIYTQLLTYLKSLCKVMELPLLTVLILKTNECSILAHHKLGFTEYEQSAADKADPESDRFIAMKLNL